MQPLLASISGRGIYFAVPSLLADDKNSQVKSHDSLMDTLFRQNLPRRYSSPSQEQPSTGYFYVEPTRAPENGCASTSRGGIWGSRKGCTYRAHPEQLRLRRRVRRRRRMTFSYSHFARQRQLRHSLEHAFHGEWVDAAPLWPGAWRVNAKNRRDQQPTIGGKNPATAIVGVVLEKRGCCKNKNLCLRPNLRHGVRQRATLFCSKGN